MIEVPDNKLKYIPKVDTKVVLSDGLEHNIAIPVPNGQEWLYAILEKQEKSLRLIKRWVMYFGILSVISLSLAGLYLLFLVFVLSRIRFY